MAGLTIDVSENGMQAVLQGTVAPDADESAAEHSIRKLLKKAGIVYGVLDDDVAAAAAVLAATHKLQPSVIARGSEPHDGRDGYIEHFVNLGFSLTPPINVDGRADYYNVHVFESVRSGQKLLKIHPPCAGIRGTDVFGAPVASADGIPVRIEPGEGVAVADDTAVLVATCDGHVHVREQKICVDKVLIIDSDIDFHTGNIEFNGDIMIRGDVRSGFSIRAQGSVCIHGVVEDAIVKSGENIVVHGGFIGQGQGRIESGLDIVLAYVRNQTVIAKRNILISGESIDANLIAGDSIRVETRKGGIIGGRALARNAVMAYNLGNSSEVPTSICVGIDYLVKSRLSQVGKAIEKLEEGVVSATAGLEEFRGAAFGSEEKSRRKARLSAQYEENNRRIETLRREQADLCKKLNVHDAQVRVTGTVFPDVMIEIASNYTCVLKSPATQCFFYLKGAQICRQSLTGETLVEYPDTECRS
jgi:uncharacterized protein (DUF342 family)